VAAGRGEWGGAIASGHAQRETVEAGDVLTKRACTRMAAIAHLDLGRFEEAEALYAECLELARVSGEAFSIGFAHTDMARVGLELGRLDCLDAHVYPALEVFGSIDSTSGVAACHFLLADAAMRRGDLDETARLLGALRARLDQLSAQYRFEFLCVSCAVALERDQHAVAGAMLEAAWRRRPTELSFRDRLRLHALGLAHRAGEELWAHVERSLGIIEQMLAEHLCGSHSIATAVEIATDRARARDAVLIVERLERLTAILPARSRASRAPRA